MSYLSKDLSNLLSLGILDGCRKKSEAANRFHKCRSSEGRGDFSGFVSEDVVPLVDRLRQSVGTASVGLRNSTIQADGNRIFISLNRPNVFRHGLQEALTRGSQYGRNQLMEGKGISLAIDAADLHDTPSRWRLEKAHEILRKAVVFSGGALPKQGEPVSFDLVVSSKSRRPLENGAVVFVGKVSCRSETPITMDDFERAFSEQISQMSQVRLGEDDVNPDNNLDSLTLASLTFALLNGNLPKTVNVQLDSSIAPFCKGAVFVLYNFCRMTHVIYKYTKLEKSGSYPPLPDLDHVDFSLLSSPEEWDLMLNFVFDWPHVFESTISGLLTGDFKLHKILDFLKSLASKFSAYYRRTRILTEPRPHLLPVLHARIYLVLGLMEVYRNALDLLNLPPVQNM